MSFLRFRFLQYECFKFIYLRPPPLDTLQSSRLYTFRNGAHDDQDLLDQLSRMGADSLLGWLLGSLSLPDAADAIYILIFYSPNSEVSRAHLSHLTYKKRILIQIKKYFERKKQSKEKNIQASSKSLFLSYSSDFANGFCIISSRSEAKSKTSLIESTGAQSVPLR